IPTRFEVRLAGARKKRPPAARERRDFGRKWGNHRGPGHAGPAPVRAGQSFLPSGFAGSPVFSRGGGAGSASPFAGGSDGGPGVGSGGGPPLFPLRPKPPFPPPNPPAFPPGAAGMSMSITPPSGGTTTSIVVRAAS